MTYLIKGVISFLLTLLLGTGMWSVFGIKKIKSGTSRGDIRCMELVTTTPLRILSETEAPYTPEDKDKQATGVVRLRVRFNPNGKTTVIEQLSSTLPKSLTKEAIGLAWQTQFIPATLDGLPVEETRVMRYAFSKGANNNYFFNVSDEELKTKEP